MKIKNIFISVILWILCALSLNAQLSKTITVNTPGTLENLLGSDLTTTTRLILNGEINDTDFQTIKKMTSLKELDFGNANVTNNTLPHQAFHNCKTEKIILPVSLTVIGSHAFYNTNITELDLTRCPDLTTIGDYAFANTKIAKLDFSGCTELTALGRDVFQNMPIDTLDFSSNNKLTGFSHFSTFEKATFHVIIPNEMTRIPTNMFNSFYGTVDLPDRITHIGTQAFYQAKLKKPVILPPYLISIGGSAFHNSGIVRINLSSTVTKIESNAFQNCTLLMEIKSEASVPPALGNNVFYNVNKSTCKLIVPSGSVDLYTSAAQWKDFLNIEAGANSGGEDENIEDNGETSISNDHNYIVTITPLDETKSVSFDKSSGKISVDRTTSGDVRTQVSVAYFDGLGRPMQTVQRKASPSGKDLVTIQEYDDFGRESNSWLPGLSSANGAFVDFDIVKQSARSTTMNNDQSPFSFPVYEASPLNRVSEQYGPGQDWHTTKDNENENERKAVRTRYLTNNSSYPCINFSVGNNTVIKNNDYTEGQLFVTEIKDEDGNTSYEFKDKLGQVVLTRQINEGVKYDTYFVYDDFGNLRYVLPPSLIDIISNKSTGTSIGDGAVEMEQFAYIYKYDNRNRCIQKHLPGCDWIYYVYDKADRLVFTQDGEQRKDNKNEWLFSIPDAFGRPVLSGICKNDITKDKLETYLKDVVVKAKWINTANTYKGYEISGIALTTPTLLSVSYYDSYEFLNKNNFPNYIYQENKEAEGYGKVYGDHKPENSLKNKGLLTGTITYTLGGDENQSELQNKELYSVMYYDYKKQVVQVHSSNHMGGMDLTCTAYDFAGNPTKMYTEQTVKNDKNLIITTKELYTYTYDHQGRLKETKHQLNNGAAMSLAKNIYDESGRLQSNKKADSNTLNTAYTYNVRSWTKAITNPLFQQTLYYNESYGGGKPQYSGNIAAISWKHSSENITRGYAFSYDNLSRLTAANYLQNAAANSNYKTAYTYDKMGNMKTLLRYGKKDVGNSSSSYDMVDNLTMKYTGNQLINVHDAGTDLAMSTSYDFKDYSKAVTDMEYTYNRNGAMDKDLNRGITSITYNSLNLPVSMEIDNPHAKGRIHYLYSAGGIKLRTVHETDPVTLSAPIAAATTYSTGETKIKITDYVGNNIYENNTLKRILVDGGYIEDNIYHFYITDHLGNNRIVANASGTITQQNHYYPFGMTFAENSSNESQPYKYNGKEFDSELGVNQYDYSARYYEPSTSRFTTVDPHAEKYYGWSPYAYVGNNPIKLTDPTGMDWVLRYVDGIAEYYYDRDITSQDDITNKYGKDSGIAHLATGHTKYIFNDDGSVTQYTFINDSKENKYGRVMMNGTLTDNSEIIYGNSYTIFGTTDNSVNAETLHKAMFGSSYIGPNNPRAYNKKESYQYYPRGAADQAAFQHDLDYDKLGASGTIDAFTNPNTYPADKALVDRCKAIIKNPNSNPRDVAQARKIAAFFGFIKTYKEPIYSGKKVFQ